MRAWGCIRIGEAGHHAFALAQNTGLSCLQVSVHVLVMVLVVRRRHQNVDVLTEQVLLAVSKQRQKVIVRRQDFPHGIHRGKALVSV